MTEYPQLSFATDVGDLLDPLGAAGRASEVTGDEAWLRALVRTEIALVLALVEAGLAPEWMAGVADELLAGNDVDLAQVAASARSTGNPVIALVGALTNRAESIRAGAGEYIHLGATSQDIMDSAAMLIAAQTLDRLMHLLTELGEVLAVLADRYAAAPQAGRTLGQQASPTTFGFVAAGWLDAVCDLLERMRAARQRLPASLGGAVGTLEVLTRVAADRSGDAGPAALAETVRAVVRRFAAELNLESRAISWHSNRLPVVEVASVLAAATGVVGSIAAEIALLSRTEIGEVSEGLDADEGGSSAMPHKRNPVSSVLIVAAAKQAPALLSTLYGSLLVEDQRAVGGWQAEWQPLRGLERLALSSVDAAVSVVRGLRVDTNRMRANLEISHGLIHAERIAAVVAGELGRVRAFALVRSASAEVSAVMSLGSAVQGALTDEGYADDAPVRLAVTATALHDDRIDQTASGVDAVIERFRIDAASPPSAPSDPVPRGLPLSDPDPDAGGIR